MARLPADPPLRCALERDGALLHLTLARPKANIVDAQMLGALSSALSENRSRRGLRAVLLDADGPHFSFGASVEEHLRDGVKLRVYGAAKTVVDCFKHRNKIGLDVALEALKDARAKRKATADDLWRYAKICRVANVMRPYLEAVE